MTGLLQTVRSQIPASCIAGSIRKEGCRVSLPDAPDNRLIIDFDQPGSPLSQNQTRCDYLFIAELSSQAGFVSPIELKAGRASPGDVKDQLQAGADIAARLIPTNCQVQLQPVLASRSDKAGRKRIRAAVLFRSREIPIRRIRCGAPLPLP